MAHVPPCLAGLEVRADPTDPAVAHAARLLGWLGATERWGTSGSGLSAAEVSVEPGEPVAPWADWARSGAMWLTGRDDGPPLEPPGEAATAARGSMLAFELLSALAAHRVSVPGHQLLGEHAAAAGLVRRGPWSPGGAFRLMPTIDGTMGLSLARSFDLELVSALVGRNEVSDPWPAVIDWAASTPTAAAVQWAQVLGIPAAMVVEPAEAAEDLQATARGHRGGFHPFRFDVESDAGARDAETWTPRPFAPLVVDLSSLWAGPLCSQLLGLAGARIVKVESASRPDGARFGPRALFDLLHSGHESVALEFSDTRDRARLRRLIDRADVVIEASRPRAMEQLGIDPAAVVERGRNRTWLSITAYGRTGPWSNWVGFGDDAAAAAGLVAADPDTGTLVPCGDAIADPLTGMHAAVAVMASVLGGGSRVIDLALREVAGSTLRGVTRRPKAARAAEPVGGGWRVATETDAVDVEPPVMRRPSGVAPAFGADTDAVFSELGIT